MFKLSFKNLMGTAIALMAVALLALSACSTSPPGTSTEAIQAANAKVQISVGIAAVKGVRVLGDQLLLAKKITPDVAQSVQDKADVARQTLVMARSLLTTDTSTALAKLNAAQLILADLNELLTSKGMP